MESKIISSNKNAITISITVQYGNSMLENEEKIQAALNKGGVILSEEALKRFDTDGSPIKIGDIKFTSKGVVSKAYQTPYGEVVIGRHVYQTSSGGTTYCPLDDNARIVTTSTPRFAKIISFKYSDHGSGRVVEDLRISNGREVAKSYVQNVADAVASVAQLKEESWSYDLPEMEKPVKCISFGMDGAIMPTVDDGYRESMVGTIGFFDRKGERMHTIYLGAIPEYGKEKFMTKFENEITKVKGRYPNLKFVGVADGAKCNWEFLERHTDHQVTDFWHATEYLTKAADAIFNKKSQSPERKEWLDESCHKLKNNIGTAVRLIHEMESYLPEVKGDNREKLKSSITYFKNQNKNNRMRYAQHVEDNLPIGSGVTEAACKVIIKQRFCRSGMKWKDDGAAGVLSLRSLSYTTGRWDQFWEKIDNHGLPIAA
ncbi:MAG: ISKra4 family transposase [Oligoflexia bacterium]|nr:ISKra4 family transposase [Oligoflexia bacterium]